MGTLYFGEPWPARFLSGADVHRVDTPVAEPCSHCGEPIAEGDQGVLIVAVTAREPALLWKMLSTLTGADRRMKTDVLPRHRECHTRLILGSLAHVTRRCTCITGISEEPPYPGTPRQEALAVQAILDDDMRRGVLYP